MIDRVGTMTRRYCLGFSLLATLWSGVDYAFLSIADAQDAA